MKHDNCKGPIRDRVKGFKIPSIGAGRVTLLRDRILRTRRSASLPRENDRPLLELVTVHVL